MIDKKQPPKKTQKSKPVLRKKKSDHIFLLFFRICRYGVDSFIRNAWLSVAATAVMTITLLIIFISFTAQDILSNTVNNLRDKVDMSIYLKPETTDKEGEELVKEVLELSSVRSASFISSSQARQDFIDSNVNNSDIIDSIKEATNKIPATLRVVVKDINQTTELQDFTDNNELLLKFKSPDNEPSFAGTRRQAIQSIGRAVSFAQQLGFVTGAIFVTISSLIIFNTIRMAIFNRKEEIQMMKLIGADKSFIRGPFLIEAIMYGFIAAIIATLLGLWGLYSVNKTLTSYQIPVQPTINLMIMYMPFVFIITILIGAVIGVISSLFATHKYLKI